MLSGMLVATGIERTPQRLLRVHNSVSLFQHKCLTREKSDHSKSYLIYLRIYLYFRRINEYSPTDVSKANERAVNRRNNVRFNPKATIDILSQGEPPEELDDDQRRELVQKYMEVGQK